MELRLSKEKKNVTILKLSTKKNQDLIEQLKFIGAVPSKENIINTYFEFRGDIAKTANMLGLR